MGARGLARALTSAHNAHVRDVEKYTKQEQKRSAIARCEEHVESHEVFIDNITNMHLDTIKKPNWLQNGTFGNSAMPIKAKYYENIALRNLNSYAPSIFDRLFRKVEKNIKLLDLEVQKSKEKDSKDYDEEIKKWNIQGKEIAFKNSINIGLKNKDPEIYKRIIEEIIVHEKSKFSGRIDNIECSSNSIKLNVYIETFDKIIPHTYPHILKRTAEVTKKDLSKKKRMSMYFDYVLSSSLYHALQVCEHIPIESVIISTYANLLDTSTGKFSNRKILEVHYDKNILDDIDIEYICLEDLIYRFKLISNYKPTSGFSPIG